MSKRTFQPNKGKRRNTHGYLKRTSTHSGRMVLKRRHLKGRKKITV